MCICIYIYKYIQYTYNIYIYAHIYINVFLSFSRCCSSINLKLSKRPKAFSISFGLSGRETWHKILLMGGFIRWRLVVYPRFIPINPQSFFTSQVDVMKANNPWYACLVYFPTFTIKKSLNVGEYVLLLLLLFLVPQLPVF